MDPVGVGVSGGVRVSVSVSISVTLSCLNDISWISGWILTKFAWTKSWLGFGDLDLIFKVSAGLKLPNLSPKVLVCTISHELVGRFQPDLHGYNIGTWWSADLILVTLTYFSRSVIDLTCQLWAKRCLCAQYLMNQLADFNQICMAITFGHDKKLNRFWWPWSNFQGHCQTSSTKIKPKGVCPLVTSWTIGWNVTKFASLY